MTTEDRLPGIAPEAWAAMSWHQRDRARLRFTRLEDERPPARLPEATIVGPYSRVGSSHLAATYAPVPIGPSSPQVTALRDIVALLYEDTQRREAERLRRLRAASRERSRRRRARDRAKRATEAGVA